jgi:hypothetical protein
MQAVVRISTQLEEDRVRQYLSVLKIPHISIGRVTVPAQKPSCVADDPCIFYLDVSPGGAGFDNEAALEHLDKQPSSLMLFNPEVQDRVEPKVIYMTDHSARASENLESFKRLEPKGFPGATVISESETLPTNLAWKAIRNQVLSQTRSAVQTSRANLIIANYDLNNSGRKASRLECLARLVEQNKCHVLILKA